MSELMKPETMGFLERVVRDPTIDVVKVEQIIALQERILDREARREFAEAMNRLQSEMPQITKDETNPHARSRYASYEGIDAVLRPLYTKHGFSVHFKATSNGNRIRVACVVSRGGHSETMAELESGPDTSGSQGRANKTEVQGVGSIVSYLRRYTLMAAFAVALQDDDTDDDGESQRRAPAPGNPRRHPQQPPQDLPQDGPEYPFATSKGGHIFRTGSEWIERWRRLCEQCRINSALDKLQEALDMNAGPIFEVGVFDPQAADEVKALVQATLAGPAGPDEADRVGA